MNPTQWPDVPPWPPPSEGLAREPTAPSDGLAVAAVMLTSVWLWWVGTFVGTAIAIYVLVRSRRRVDPASSRRWGTAALVLGAVGIVTFAMAASAAWPRISKHNDDSAAKASLLDVARVYDHGNPFAPGAFAAASGNEWTVPGGSSVHVISPLATSTGYKSVSAEVWQVTSTSGRPFGAELYAAVLSSSGACFFMRDQGAPSYLSFATLFPPESCSADSARDITDWDDATLLAL